MANVTDSLDLVLGGLGELQHDLDAVAAKLFGNDYDQGTDLVGARGDLADAQVHLAYLVGAVQAERRILVDLGALVKSQRCDNCRRYFEVSTQHGSQRRYCSAACRTAAWRVRSDASQQHSQVTEG
jgi:hypothetical protein